MSKPHVHPILSSLASLSQVAHCPSSGGGSRYSASKS